MHSFEHEARRRNGNYCVDPWVRWKARGVEADGCGERRHAAHTVAHSDEVIVVVGFEALDAFVDGELHVPIAVPVGVLEIVVVGPECRVGNAVSPVVGCTDDGAIMQRKLSEHAVVLEACSTRAVAEDDYRMSADDAVDAACMDTGHSVVSVRLDVPVT